MGKRDIVLSTFKGMELFLFDFDLRLMYGICKATWLEGYNIELKALNLAFHSKVSIWTLFFFFFTIFQSIMVYSKVVLGLDLYCFLNKAWVSLRTTNLLPVERVFLDLWLGLIKLHLWKLRVMCFWGLSLSILGLGLVDKYVRWASTLFIYIL